MRTDNIKYLTQIDKKTLGEILTVGDVKQGDGIRIEVTAGGVEINIDETRLKQMFWAFLKNGGQASTFDNLENITLDPGR